LELADVAIRERPALGTASSGEAPEAEVEITISIGIERYVDCSDHR
jgi:hypothetical protein